MNEKYIADLTEKIERFAIHTENQREMLIERTLERFRHELDDFNRLEGPIKIDGFTCGYGNLELNKNIYYLMLQVYTNMKRDSSNEEIESFEGLVIQGEKVAKNTMIECISKAIANCGGLEHAKAVAAVEGKYHITLNGAFMEEWINTHTAIYIKMYLFMYYGAECDSMDFAAIISDIIQTFVTRYSSIKSCVV